MRSISMWIKQMESKKMSWIAATEINKTYTLALVIHKTPTPIFCLQFFRGVLLMRCSQMSNVYRNRKKTGDFSSKLRTTMLPARNHVERFEPFWMYRFYSIACRILMLELKKNWSENVVHGDGRQTNHSNRFDFDWR